jgi:hypothetical protein
MADADRSLQRLVEEGAGAAQQPSLEHLRRHVGRRRARRRFAGAALAVAMLAVPVAWYADSGVGSGQSVSGAAAPTGTIVATARSVPPPLTPQQRAVLAQQAGTLTVEPVSVVAGGAVTVNGHGCAAGRAVSLGFGPSVGAGAVVTVHAGPGDSFEGTVTVPLAAGAGVRRLWAQCTVPAASSPAVQYGAVYVFAS